MQEIRMPDLPWGPYTVERGAVAYDGNFHGAINVLDLIELLLAFGMTCP